jgi:hypothetical protein
MSKVKNTEILSEEIKKKVIDIIINSDLNIQSIPDDVEREMYNTIFDVLEITLQNSNPCSQFIQAITNWCCKKKK